MRFIGFYNYTVILTYLSLICGMLGIRCAYLGNFDAAIFCLAMAGICDLFDGPVARTKKNRSARQKGFGIQLDSLCDIVCFGVFPAIFVYLSGMNGTLGMILCLFYVLCALIRLAFFNVLESERQQTEGGCAKAYRGLPVTTISIVLPIFYVIARFFLTPTVTLPCYHILTFTTAFLFISDFRVPKLDIAKLFHHHHEKGQSE